MPTSCAALSRQPREMFTMKTSVHQESRKRYTVEQYVNEFGPQLDAYGQECARPTIVCIACGYPVRTVAERSALSDAVWTHQVSKNAPWCPLKENNGGQYVLRAPSIGNNIASEQIRTQFFQNWKLHWSHILEIAPACEISKLVRFLEHADSIRFWAHPALEEWQLPYIFLASCEFPAERRKKAFETQSGWIRFRFDATVRQTIDLWHKPPSTWKFLCLSYKAPIISKEPSPSELVDVELVEVDPSFLQRVQPQEYTSEAKTFKKYFPKEFVAETLEYDPG